MNTKFATSDVAQVWKAIGKTRIRPIFAAALLLASVGGMLVLLRNSAVGIPWQSLRPRPELLLIAFAATALASVNGAKYWQCLLSAVGARISLGDAMRIWCLSNIAKYGLGALSQYGGRLFLTERLGLNRRSTSASIVLEVLLILGSGSLILLFLAPFAERNIVPHMLHSFTSLGPIAGTFGIVAIWACPNLLIKLLPADFRPPVDAVGRKDVGQALAIVVANWLLLGISAFFVVQSIVAIPLSAIPSITFSVTLAYIGGLLAFVPLGAGVRDVTLALLLAQFVPPPIAVTVAVLSRIITILAEFVLGAIFLIAWRIRYRGNSRGTPPTTSLQRQ